MQINREDFIGYMQEIERFLEESKRIDFHLSEAFNDIITVEQGAYLLDSYMKIIERLCGGDCEEFNLISWYVFHNEMGQGGLRVNDELVTSYIDLYDVIIGE